MLAGVVVVALIAYGGYTYYAGQSTQEQLLVVTPAPFVQEVSVSGKVEAAKDVNLGFAQSGRVSRVTVTVGDKVRAGEVLAEVENGDLLALVAQREASLSAAESVLASLKSGTRPEEIAIAEADVTAKQATVRQAAQAIVDEVQDAYTAADNAIRVEVDQFMSNGTGTNPQVTFTISSSQLEASVENGRKQMEDLLNTWGAELASVTASGDLGLALRNAKDRMSQVSAYLLITNSAVVGGGTNSAVTQASLNSYAADVAAARTAVSAASGALTTAETAYINAQSAVVSAEKTLALRRAGATVDDIRTEEARVRAARASVDDARASVLKTRILAPFSGTVTVVDAKVGQVASVNTGVISLISESDVRVESYVPEINLALIALGDTASVTLDAYGDQVTFPAVLAAIDPAETERDGVSTYRALLTFTTPDPRVRAGMTANVSIVTDERPDIIAIPQKVVRLENGMKLVTVKLGESYADRQVTTGAVSSLGTIEIVSGLSAGDVVVVERK